MVQREQYVRCEGNSSAFVLQWSFSVPSLLETHPRLRGLLGLHFIWLCPQIKEEPKQGYARLRSRWTQSARQVVWPESWGGPWGSRGLQRIK